MSPIRVNPAEETINPGPIGIHFLIAAEQSNGNASVFEVTVGPGQKVPAPPHRNDAYEEILYGLDGVLTWVVDGKPIDVGPGQALCIPRGATHGFVNNTDAPARQLVIITPAIMGPAYFREASAALAAAAAAGGPPDRAKMAALLKKHGMTVVAPPPA
jgi:quercetin dioxygenase-like cupin family protein